MNIDQAIKELQSGNPAKRVILIAGNNFDEPRHLDLIRAIAGPGWVFDQDNLPVITNLLKYFNGVPGGYDLDKGILLIGEIGSGKTSIFNIFQKYVRSANWFKITDSRTVIRAFSKDKFIGLERYSFNYQLPDNKEPAPFHLCIDDLGTENRESRHYGESVDVMGELILDRYSIFMNPKFWKLTHFTSNLKEARLLEYYGARIYDRLIEMCNFVELPGGSRRK